MTAANGPAGGFQLEVDPFGRLVLLDAAGRRHVGVVAVRAFPISEPNFAVSLCDADGRELVWIEELARLEPRLRQTIEDHLARREFVPLIRRIVRVRPLPDPAEWEVDTDRGRTTFHVQNDSDIRRLDARRALIVDTHGIRYLIPEVAALDPRSRRFLERYL
jgi:hypothetical protein